MEDKMLTAIKRKAQGDAALAYELHKSDPEPPRGKPNFWAGHASMKVYIQVLEAETITRIRVWREQYEHIYIQEFIATWKGEEANEHH